MGHIWVTEDELCLARNNLQLLVIRDLLAGQISRSAEHEKSFITSADAQAALDLHCWQRPGGHTFTWHCSKGARQNISYEIACVPSGYSDQHAHLLHFDQSCYRALL